MNNPVLPSVPEELPDIAALRAKHKSFELDGWWWCYGCSDSSDEKGSPVSSLWPCDAIQLAEALERVQNENALNFQNSVALHQDFEAEHKLAVELAVALEEVVMESEAQPLGISSVPPKAAFRQFAKHRALLARPEVIALLEGK